MGKLLIKIVGFLIILYLMIGYGLANLFCRPWGYCDDKPYVQAPILNPKLFIFGK